MNGFIIFQEKTAIPPTLGGDKTTSEGRAGVKGDRRESRRDASVSEAPLTP